MEMQERRRQRETEFELRQLEKEKGRVELARAKERDREDRLATARAQQRAHIQDLQKKIQQKVRKISQRSLDFYYILLLAMKEYKKL